MNCPLVSMNCPLVGHISIFLPPFAPSLAPDDAAAVRVSGYRGHDMIVLNPAASVWDRMAAITDCVLPDERDLLLWDATCTCARMRLSA